MENRVKASKEAIGTYCLILDTKHYLDLLETCYIPSIYRNFFLYLKLMLLITLLIGCFILFKYIHLINSRILCDMLYKINLDSLYVKMLLILH